MPDNISTGQFNDPNAPGALRVADATPGVESPTQIAMLWEGAYERAHSKSSPTQLTITMTAIALAESGGQTSVTNPSSATGLWQVETSAHPQYTQAELETAETNADAAVSVFGSQGFGAWTTYTSGAYKAYVATATKAVKDPNFISSIGNSIGSVADDVGDVVDAGVSVVDFLGKVTEALFTEKGWIRIIKFLAGVAIAIVALRALFSGTAVGNAVGSIVSTVKDGVTADE
jgi:hypothetical protein